MDIILGFLSPILVYLLVFVLHAILPGKWMQGYATKADSTEKLTYRLNGMLVFLVVIVGWAFLCYSSLLSWDWFYRTRWYGLAGAVVFGLLFSFLLVVNAPPVKKSFLADFFLGRLENPQLWEGRVDAKMWLYLIGAILLALNVLSFSAFHYQNFGVEHSWNIYIAAGLLLFFVSDYLTFERVHLYTYDLFAERVGFKLGWGCIAFYPFFYVIPLWVPVGLPGVDTSVWLLVVFVGVFFLGWGMSRGANLQKYYFKKDPTRAFLGITPRTITDGQHTLLVNGFWGVSRHINYLGEILMATGIVLCVGHYLLPWPWLYPLYYIALLFPRQLDDDKRCEKKYGMLWSQYTKQVPYRIIPFLY